MLDMASLYERLKNILKSHNEKLENWLSLWYAYKSYNFTWSHTKILQIQP